MIAEVITAPLFGPLGDRYGRRPVFLICVCFWGVGSVAFGLTQRLWTVILTRGFREYLPLTTFLLFSHEGFDPREMQRA